MQVPDAEEFKVREPVIARRRPLTDNGLMMKMSEVEAALAVGSISDARARLEELTLRIFRERLATLTSDQRSDIEATLEFLERMKL